jgi:isoamylase
MILPTNHGQSSPLGATVTEDGVNFSLFSRSGSGVELLLFDQVEDAKPARVVTLDPVKNRTYHYWHTAVKGVRPGQIYGYRVCGKHDQCKLLLDPYGRGVTVPRNYDRWAGAREGDNCAVAMKSVVIDSNHYDWEGDTPLRIPSARTIVYEMHVRGFTRHPSSGVSEKKRGTYSGLIEKIPYLKELGINAVELLPVFQFDAQDCPRGVVNYWGYQPVSFFAPHQAYASSQDGMGPVNEFRDMVKALHRAGIEVILDVVYNHTAEGGDRGPTFCFRGLGPSTYYIVDQESGHHLDYSGCGNTLNANNPITRRMIVDSIRYWVEQMHVDGFRFDLASILARDPCGNVLPDPPVLWDLETDPALAGTKFIAEAWDAAGLYQVGNFVGDSWKEWNGRFRDDARSFFRGTPGSLRRFTDRLVGSPEVFAHEEREPEQSINFVTCHDGFTLNDVVSYDNKHNEANGENNRDGGNDNMSWNCGVEGPTNDPAIERLRNRQVKNYLTATMLSIGMPMILMGDEVRNTQNGNNNAYCHDTEWNWFDWGLLKKHGDVHRFVAMLNSRRVLRSMAHEHARLTLSQLIQQANKSWHGVKLNQPDWGDNSHSFALTVELRSEQLLVHLIFNAYSQPLDFELPKDVTWRRWIDTALDSPNDIVDWREAASIKGASYHAESRSVVILIANLERKSS